jgi:ubiquinone/menaquinone biosynthesis C-methylase UbiE
MELALNCYMLDLLLEAEIPIVLREFRRVLRPDGCLVLLIMADQRRILRACGSRTLRLDIKRYHGASCSDFQHDLQMMDSKNLWCWRGTGSIEAVERELVLKVM